MLQNVTVCGKNPTRWTALVGSHRGTKCYKMSLWEKTPPLVGSVPPLVGLIPPWDQMLQNVTVGKNPVVHGFIRRTRRPRLACGRAAPATTANSISRRVRRNSRIRRHQLGAAVLSYHSQGSISSASSIGGRNPHSSRCPRLHRPTPTQGNPNPLEPARRSSAIPHIAGDLQKLYPAWGGEEPRNHPASA